MSDSTDAKCAGRDLTRTAILGWRPIALRTLHHSVALAAATGDDIGHNLSYWNSRALCDASEWRNRWQWAWKRERFVLFWYRIYSSFPDLPKQQASLRTLLFRLIIHAVNIYPLLFITTRERCVVMRLVASVCMSVRLQCSNY